MIPVMRRAWNDYDDAYRLDGYWRLSRNNEGQGNADAPVYNVLVNRYILASGRPITQILR